MLECVISGGQTGVDRAALDAAIHCEIPIAGWCPRGRRSEDGQIPSKYPLQETSARSYAVRTEWNIRDSDATLILVGGPLSGGTRLTVRLAEAGGREYRIVRVLPDSQHGLLDSVKPDEEDADAVADWIRELKIRRLNVAGPRGSAHSETYAKAFRFLCEVFSRLRKIRTDKTPPNG